MLARRDELSAWRIRKSPGRMMMAPITAAGSGTAGEVEAFLWSLADLMTLLLIFFIMLYATAIQRVPVIETVINQIDPSPVPEVADSQSDRADTFGVFTPSATEITILETDGVEAQTKATEAVLAPPPEPEVIAHVSNEVSLEAERLNRQMVVELADSFSKDFYVRWDERRPVIVLGERITFNAGQARLLSDANGALKRVAELISGLGDCRVVVSGHSDDRPIRTDAFPSNWELSAARAASVAKVLMANGIAPQQLTIQGQSEFKPLLANTSPENRRANRRVEISVITGNQQPMVPY